MQSRRLSMIETLVGTLIGFVLSVLASMIVYPLHGHSFTLAQNMSITVIFTVLSIARGYGVRRAFNWIGQLLQRWEQADADAAEHQPIDRP